MVLKTFGCSLVMAPLAQKILYVQKKKTCHSEYQIHTVYERMDATICWNVERGQRTPIGE